MSRVRIVCFVAALGLGVIGCRGSAPPKAATAQQGIVVAPMTLEPTQGSPLSAMKLEVRANGEIVIDDVAMAKITGNKVTFDGNDAATMTVNADGTMVTASSKPWRFVGDELVIGDDILRAKVSPSGETTILNDGTPQLVGWFKGPRITPRAAALGAMLAFQKQQFREAVKKTEDEKERMMAELSAPEPMPVPPPPDPPKKKKSGKKKPRTTSSR